MKAREISPMSSDQKREEVRIKDPGESRADSLVTPDTTVASVQPLSRI